jgi:outer membrane protein TolC
MLRQPSTFYILAVASGLTVLAAGCHPEVAARPPGGSSETESGGFGDIAASDLEHADVLERRALVCAVLERNQDLAAAEEALAAANARARTPITAGDTRLSWSMAPGSIGSDVSFGQVVEVEQAVRLGQRRLEREVARRQADAIGHRRDAARNELAFAAASLYDEHFELARALETNAAHHALLTELVEAATRRYAAGLVSSQDPLQAELERARVEQERVEIESQRRVAVARTNRLLHRPADVPLPAVPDHLGRVDEAADPTQLRAEALVSRPEILAAAVETDARTRAVSLTRRRFAPELSAVASYNSMWPNIEHRFMVGVGLQLPLQLGALRAGVAEARAEQRRAGRLAEAERDRVGAEVEEAIARLEQAEKTARIHEARLIPTARERVEAARIGYESNTNDIDALIDAERELRSVELAYQRTLAELDRRRAELEWAVGRAPCDAKGARQ